MSRPSFHYYVRKKSNRTCAYCNRAMWHPTFSVKDGPQGLMATIDHVVPKSKGGTDHKKNLRLVCYRCNQAKADRMDIQTQTRPVHWDHIPGVGKKVEEG